MGSNSSILKPVELSEFRKLHTTTIENVEIPAKPENRSITDRKGYILFAVGLLILLPFLIYTCVKSDFRRFSHDYDNCGNMCGYNNPVVEGRSCSGKSYLDLRYSHNHNCVRSCPSNTQPILGRCDFTNSDDNLRLSESRFGRFRRQALVDDENLSQADLDKALEHCRTHWWKFVLSIFITIALSLLIMVLLRYTPGVVVWGVIIISFIVLVVVTLAGWYLYFSAGKGTARGGLLGFSIFWTIFTLVVIVILIFLFKKIGLVVLLFKEATKAIAAMPLMMLLPVLATIVQVVVALAFIATTGLMLTAAELKKFTEDDYRYEMNGVHIFTIIYNIIVTTWVMKFVAGLQYMIIAGSVCHWYFAKNKQYLDSPIGSSFFNAVRFHLGSLLFGSFILTLMAVIKALIRSVFRNEKAQAILSCCCSNIEAFLKFLSENSYIETSLHGQSFFRSGKRAAKLLLSNAASVIAINSVGDFVLGMIVFILLVVSTGISYGFWMNLGPLAVFPTLIMLIVNVIIISVMFGIFSTVIDTLFICFCEDKEINDGISRPYFMSRGLMEFVESSKKVYDKHE